jgi:hypothetical protein
MRVLGTLPVVLALVATPSAVCAQQSLDRANKQMQEEVLDKIISQEQAEMESLRQYSPLVETYVQLRRPDKLAGAAPSGDKYYLGRAALAHGVELEPLARDTRTRHNKLIGAVTNFLSMEFLPRGFLQMIFLDTNGFDRSHYNFSYVHREFLGDVRCMVFDVDPRVKAEKGRFVGRIWVEDQGLHIVRFNGIYNGSSILSYYFSFDSWRQNAGKNEWLPAYIYSEDRAEFPGHKKEIVPAFRAQTRLWGYAPAHAQDEQELTKLLVESPTSDQAESAADYSPLQQTRLWTRQAEDNIIATLEKFGLLAPDGEVDKTLETVVNNILVSNGLEVEPQVRCRVLQTSSFESYAMGHTIVMSRGLLDVLPNEAALAALLAHELGHVLLGHPMDTQFAFFDRIRLDERGAIRRFALSRPPEQEFAANQKGSELLMNSPYKDQLASAQTFLQAISSRSKEIPNLISPHLGDSMPTNWSIASSALAAETQIGKTAGAPQSITLPQATASQTASIVALPLGGRIKVDPFTGQLHLLKFKPTGLAPEYEKMPFEVTPVFLYLTRQNGGTPVQKPVE